MIKIQIAKLQREFHGFLRRNRVFIKRIYVASIYTSCGGIANSFFPWHGADPFKNVAHWVLGSASPVMAITYCRSQGDSLLVYCLWTTRLRHDREMPVVCNVVVRDALHGAWRSNSARLEASRFLHTNNDGERFFMAVSRYRRQSSAANWPFTKRCFIFARIARLIKDIIYWYVGCAI